MTLPIRPFVSPPSSVRIPVPVTVEILTDPVSTAQLKRISERFTTIATDSEPPHASRTVGRIDTWREPLESLLALARSVPDAVVECDSPPLPRSPFDTDENPSDDAWRWYTTVSRRVATIVRRMPPDAKTLFLRRSAALAEGRVERLLAARESSTGTQNRGYIFIKENSSTDSVGVLLGTEPDMAEQLEALSLRYPIGAATVRALTAAGELAWRRGDLPETRRLWTDAFDASVSSPPEWLRSADIPTPIELAVRLVVASLAEGDAARAERELAILAQRYPDATGRFCGTMQNGVELLRTMIDHAAVQPVINDIPTAPTQNDTPSPSDNAPDNPESVIIGDRRFARTAALTEMSIEAIDLASEGRLLWRVMASELPEDGLSRETFDTPLVADGWRVYTVLRGQRTGATETAKTILSVLALDADTGRQLWRRPLAGITELPGKPVGNAESSADRTTAVRMWITPDSVDETRRTLRIETNFGVTARLDRRTGTPLEVESSR